jgi:hypothetical protein
MGGIKVSKEQKVLIDLAMGAAIEAGVKYFTGYYDKILDSDEEQQKELAEQLKADRKSGFTTIDNL